jgi:sulfoxide reductase heme-binding subunit YedZ
VRRGLGASLLKPLVFVLAALPALIIAHDAFYGAIAANPYRAVVRETGFWSLRLLVVGLWLTPLARMLGQGWPVSLRRMIGLYAAFYAGVHLAVWAMDYEFDWGFLLGEVVARTYLWVGLVAVLLMLPLVLTSTKWAVKRLGARTWRSLHRLVFPTALVAWIHYELIGHVYQAELYVTALGLALALLWRILRPPGPLAAARNRA